MTWLLAITTMSAFAQQATVTGPDSFLKVNVSVKQGIPIYSVTYKDKTIIRNADRKSTRLNSSHWNKSRMPSSA